MVKTCSLVGFKKNRFFFVYFYGSWMQRLTRRNQQDTASVRSIWLQEPPLMLSWAQLPESDQSAGPKWRSKASRWTCSTNEDALRDANKPTCLLQAIMSMAGLVQCDEGTVVLKMEKTSHLASLFLWYISQKRSNETTVSVSHKSLVSALYIYYIYIRNVHSLLLPSNVARD